jgi:hypothetical protein
MFSAKVLFLLPIFCCFLSVQNLSTQPTQVYYFMPDTDKESKPSLAVIESDVFLPEHLAGVAAHHHLTGAPESPEPPCPPSFPHQQATRLGFH